MRVICRSKSTLSPTIEERASRWKNWIGLGDAVFDEHAVSVTGDQRRATGAQMVGQQDGGFLVAQLGNGDLADGALVISQFDALIQNLGRAEGARQRGQGDPAPSRGGAGSRFGPASFWSAGAR